MPAHTGTLGAVFFAVAFGKVATQLEHLEAQRDEGLKRADVDDGSASGAVAVHVEANGEISTLSGRSTGSDKHPTATKFSKTVTNQGDTVSICCSMSYKQMVEEHQKRGTHHLSHGANQYAVNLAPFSKSIDHSEMVISQCFPVPKKQCGGDKWRCVRLDTQTSSSADTIILYFSDPTEIVTHYSRATVKGIQEVQQPVCKNSG